MARTLPGPTLGAVIHGEAMAVAFCALLVTQSRAFVLTPYPDDLWRFDLKDEGGALALLEPFNPAEIFRAN